MPTTPIYGFPTPEPGDPPNVPLDMQDLAESIENELVRVDNDIQNVADMAADAARGWRPITNGIINNAPNFDIDLTNGGQFPPGTFSLMRFWLQGSLDAEGYVWARVNNINGTTHRWGQDTVQYNDGSRNNNRNNGTAQWQVARWFGTFCELEMVIHRTNATSTNPWRCSSSTGGGATEHVSSVMSGRLVGGSQLISSIRFAGTIGTSTQFSNCFYFAEGYIP